MEIRELSHEDVTENRDLILNLFATSYAENFAGRYEINTMVKQRYMNLLKFVEDGSAIFLGALEKNIVCGMLWAYERTLMGERRIHITDIVVGEGYRGKGLGSCLLEKLKVMAKEREVVVIDLLVTQDNKNSVEFYHHKGFEIERLQMALKV